MNVRRAEPRDLQAILDIYNQAVLSTTATYDYEPRSLEAHRHWFEEHVVFVAEDGDGRIAGWSSLGPFHPRPGYQFTVEDSIYVAEDCRGRGIGTQLLPPLIDEARRLGKRAIVAVIDAESEASLRLHKRVRFQHAGRLHQAGFKFGRWLDVVYLELLLPGPSAAVSPSGRQ